LQESQAPERAGSVIVDLARRYYEDGDLTVLPRAIANLKAFEYYRDSEGALTIQGFETCAGRGGKATSQSVEVGGNDWTAFRIGHDGELGENSLRW